MAVLATDRASDWVAAGTPEPLRSDLKRLLGEDAVLGRATDLIRYASDASPYRLIPGPSCSRATRGRSPR